MGAPKEAAMGFACLVNVASHSGKDPNITLAHVTRSPPVWAPENRH